MKEYMRTLVQANPNPIQGRNIAREYLQARVLERLQKMGAFVPLAFLGDTALRFLYGLKRFSDDLNFSLENGKGTFDFDYYLQGLKTTFNAEGYRIKISYNTDHILQSALLEFGGLSYELGLSPDQNENLSIKFEVDTKPPQGAVLQTSLVRKYVFLNLHYYDRASLFAGKIHALLTRNFTKGRDVYDLLWFLSDPTWPSPNFVFLKNALVQTGWKEEFPNEDNWRPLLRDRMNDLNWKRVISDVSPFLENLGDMEFLTKENIIHQLKS